MGHREATFSSPVMRRHSSQQQRLLRRPHACCCRHRHHYLRPSFPRRYLRCLPTSHSPQMISRSLHSLLASMASPSLLHYRRCRGPSYYSRSLILLPLPVLVLATHEDSTRRLSGPISKNLRRKLIPPTKCWQTLDFQEQTRQASRWSPERGSLCPSPMLTLL